MVTRTRPMDAGARAVGARVLQQPIEARLEVREGLDGCRRRDARSRLLIPTRLDSTTTTMVRWFDDILWCIGVFFTPRCVCRCVVLTSDVFERQRRERDVRRRTVGVERGCVYSTPIVVDDGEWGDDDGYG
jgi:hypothetical protein